MRVLIAGGSGLIGTALTKKLLENGHEVSVLSRKVHPELPKGVKAVQWDARTLGDWVRELQASDAVINLAGENLAGEGFFPERWTEKKKQRIIESRVMAGQIFVEAIKQSEKHPAVFLQSSGIGIYGISTSAEFTENDPPGKDFLAQVGINWEAPSHGLKGTDVRLIVMRTGVVLSSKGGAFTRLRLPFQLFVGGHFGSGDQVLSWIHIDDFCRAVLHFLEHPETEGIYNLTAPHPVTGKKFGQILGQVMQRPSFLPVPSFAVKLMFGEVATMVLDGQRVLPERLVNSGFSFLYHELHDVLSELVTNKKEQG